MGPAEGPGACEKVEPLVWLLVLLLLVLVLLVLLLVLLLALGEQWACMVLCLLLMCCRQWGHVEGSGRARSGRRVWRVGGRRG